MRVEIRHADDVSAERDHTGRDGITRQGINVRVAVCDRNTIHVGRYCIDENHAQALVLALQAAIAEVQARAVSL